MKVVITGATGFIGKRLLTELAGKGGECIALVRDIARASDLPGKKITWDANRASEEFDVDLIEALSGAEAIVHLAGEPIAAKRWDKDTKNKIFNSRIEGTRKVVEAIRRLSPDKRPNVLISGSAVGFYGNRGDEKLDDSSAVGQGYLSTLVQAWEEEANKVQELGVRVVQIRTGVVLGSGGGALAKMKPAVLGSGRQWMSWIHLDDAVRFIEFAISHSELNGPVNLTAPNPVTNAEFTSKFSKATGAIAKFRVPACVLKLVLGEMSVVLLDSCNSFPEKAIRAGFRFTHDNIDSALAEIFSEKQKT